MFASGPLPPPGDVLGGKLRRIVGRADKHRTGVAHRVVNSEGNGHPEALGAKIVIADRRGLQAPHLAGIFEVSNQFFLFGIHADDRQAPLEKLPFLLGHIGELLVPAWAFRRQPLGIGM